MDQQNNIQHLKDLMEKGNLTVDQANVEMVRMERFRLVTNGLPADVRKALNGAVKAGLLARLPKAGRKPEAYFHPTFDYLAKAARNEHERQIVAAVAGVCG